MNAPDGKLTLKGTSPLLDKRLSTDVYAVILTAIHTRQLRPGDRITEAEIATQLGISRSPVREAFAQLTNQGLLDHIPRRGSYVATLDEEDISNLRDCRQLIEGFAARSVAGKITRDQQQELEALIDEMVTSAIDRDWVQTVFLNAKFHERVVIASGNSILHRMWATVDPLAWLVAATKEPGSEHDPNDLRARHMRLLETLVAGDPDAAEDAFRQHVAESLIPTDFSD